MYESDVQADPVDISACSFNASRTGYRIEKIDNTRGEYDEKSGKTKKIREKSINGRTIQKTSNEALRQFLCRQFLIYLLLTHIFCLSLEIP